MLGGAVHSYGVPLVLIQSVIGPNSDPWIKVDSGVESRGLIVLDGIMASSAAVCGGLGTSVLHSTATPVGLALNRSEALVHNSSIDSSAQYDATSYLIYSESSNFASHASQDHAISQEAMYAPLNPFFGKVGFSFCVLPGAVLLLGAHPALQAYYHILHQASAMSEAITHRFFGHAQMVSSAASRRESSVFHLSLSALLFCCQ